MLLMGNEQLWRIFQLSTAWLTPGASLTCNCTYLHVYITEVETFCPFCSPRHLHICNEKRKGSDQQTKFASFGKPSWFTVHASRTAAVQRRCLEPNSPGDNS